MLDLASASYYATEWHDDVINPAAPEVFNVVAKTRGKMQYYQSQKDFAFNLTWFDLKSGNRPMINDTPEMSQLEAEALNRALSIRRKTVTGIVLLMLAVVPEAAFGIDISILTSGSSEVSIVLPEPEAPS